MDNVSRRELSKTLFGVLSEMFVNFHRRRQYYHEHKHRSYVADSNFPETFNQDINAINRQVAHKIERETLPLKLSSMIRKISVSSCNALQVVETLFRVTVH